LLRRHRQLVDACKRDPSQGIAALAILASYDACEKGLAAVKLLQTKDIVSNPVNFNALRNALSGFASFKSPALVVKSPAPVVKASTSRGKADSVLSDIDDDVSLTNETLSPVNETDETQESGETGDKCIIDDNETPTSSSQVFE